MLTDELINVIDLFINFIDEYKELLNTHNVQFLIDHHWTSTAIIKNEIRRDLEHLIQVSDEAPNLLKTFKSISQNESANQFESLNELVFKSLNLFDKTWHETVLTKADKLFDLESCNSENLKTFEQNYLQKFAQIEKQNRFMNEKKKYEVDLMSKFVAKLCKNLNINKVIL
jgi:hypothetical protein